MANSTTNVDSISQSQSGKEVTANAFFDAASQALLFGRRASTSSGLTWGYFGGNFVKSDGTMTQIANGTLALTASTTNYITVLKSTGVVYCSNTTTAWNDTWNYTRLYSVVTGASSVTSYTDAREISKFSGPRLPSAPVTKTGNFSVAAGEDFIVCNGSASITVTLPDYTAWIGRSITIKTIAAFTVVSATSNVLPINSATAGAAILAATAGKFVTLVSDGTGWVVMAGN